MKNRFYFVLFILVLIIQINSFCAESGKSFAIASTHIPEELAESQKRLDNCPELTKAYIINKTKPVFYQMAINSINKQDFLLPYFYSISLSLYIKNIQSLLINPQFQQIEIQNNAENVIKKLLKKNKINVEDYTFLHYLLQINQSPNGFLKNRNYQQTVLLPILLKQKEKIELLKGTNLPLFEQASLIFDHMISQIYLILMIFLKEIAPQIKAEKNILGHYLEALKAGSCFPQEFELLFPQTLLGQFYQPSEEIKQFYTTFYQKLPVNKMVKLLKLNIEVPDTINQLASKVIAASMHKTEMNVKQKKDEERAAREAEKAGDLFFKELEEEEGKEKKAQKKKKAKKPSQSQAAAVSIESEAGHALEPEEFAIEEIVKGNFAGIQLPISYTKTIKNWFKNPDSLIAFYNYQGPEDSAATKQEKDRQKAYKALLNKYNNDAGMALGEITQNHTVPMAIDNYLIQYNSPVKVKEGYSVYAPLLKKRKDSDDFTSGYFELLFTKNPDNSLTVFHRLFKESPKADLLQFQEKAKTIKAEAEAELEKKLENFEEDWEDWQAASEAIIDDTNQEYTKFIKDDVEYYLLKH